MLNKILVFWGIAVIAILIIENIVITNTSYVLWVVSYSYVLAIFCTIVWFLIWYWMKWILSNDNNADDNSDDNSDDMDF